MGFVLLIFTILSLSFSQPNIVIEDLWVREVPPVSTMSAAFLKIKNTGDEEDYLIKVESEIAEIAEIHISSVKEGIIRMRRVKEVIIPPGQTVTFKPMGMHVMLINLKKTLREGEKVRFKFVFRKSGSIIAEGTVRKGRSVR